VRGPGEQPIVATLSPPGTVHDDDDSEELYRLKIYVPFIEPDDQ